ncbi:MAG: thymidine phosphorylase family protein [Burkholderiales bacterium]|nr:thymidine phosphorylase family protein [Burkholderiales bacterium]
MSANVSALRLRAVRIDTDSENVAYLARGCTACRVDVLRAAQKVSVSVVGASVEPMLAVLNVVDDPSIVGPDELGLSEQAFAMLGVPTGTPVTIGPAPRPASLDIVRRKLQGEPLDLGAMRAIARDIAARRYARSEIAAFLVACGREDLERDEVLALTRAMLETGERLDWREPLVADKHCIGGIPGNRTSMIIVPIVAAHGMLIPKTSSRAITSPAGTADTMQVLAEVELAPARLHEIVLRERGCIAWGGTARLAPLDDLLISVERPLALDSPGLMVASILSKKLAAGSTRLLLDIPVGPSAKVRSLADAQRLRKTFEHVGRALGLHVEVAVTDGTQPIGRGIGPVLEARDVMAVLENRPDAPQDLRAKSLRLAGRILEFDPDVRGGDGEGLARDILESGRAAAKMASIIDAQGRRLEPPGPGRLVAEIVAPRAGRIVGFDHLRLARAARQAGAPASPGAGLDLLVRLGDPVRAGQPLYRLHAETSGEFDHARSGCDADAGIAIG